MKFIFINFSPQVLAHAETVHNVSTTQGVVCVICDWVFVAHLALKLVFQRYSIELLVLLILLQFYVGLLGSNL